MTDLQSYLLRVTRMTSIEEVWTSHEACMASYGFDKLLYAATRFRTDNGMGDLRDALILTNYPNVFTKDYLDGGLFRDSPVVRWAMQQPGTRSWTEFAKDAACGRLSPAEMRVVEFNRKQGIVAGYAISFSRVSNRTGHGIGLSSTTMTQAEIDALWLESGQEIELINQVMHLVLSALPYGDYGRTLTDRQREVLQLVAEGKTVADVAQILGRNPATVEKHLRLAREALDVETTAQAVMKAAVQNQFFRFEV